MGALTMTKQLMGVRGPRRSLKSKDLWDSGIRKSRKTKISFSFDLTSSSSLNSVRLDVIKSWLLTSMMPLLHSSANANLNIIALILMVAIIAVLSLYWAVLFRVEDNLSALVVWVVDFDGQVAPYTAVTPVVGPQIVQAAEKLIAPSGAVGWGSLPASAFNYDPMEIRNQIYDYKAWAAVIINANATALLQNAVQSGNSSYDPMGVAQVIYVQARDETTHANYVTPQLMMFEQQVTSMFGEVGLQSLHGPDVC